MAMVKCDKISDVRHLDGLATIEWESPHKKIAVLATMEIPIGIACLAASAALAGRRAYMRSAIHGDPAVA